MSVDETMFFYSVKKHDETEIIFRHCAFPSLAEHELGVVGSLRFPQHILSSTIVQNTSSCLTPPSFKVLKNAREETTQTLGVSPILKHLR